MADIVIPNYECDLDRLNKAVKAQIALTPNDELCQWKTEMDGLETRDLEESKGYFRLANQMIFLTYKTHLPKDAYINWLTARFRGTKCTIIFIRISHEIGRSKSIPYEHSHVLIKLDRPFQCKFAKWFDFNPEGQEIHPHIRSVTGKNAWVKLLRYMAKEDPDNKDLAFEATLLCKQKGKPKNDDDDDDVPLCDKIWNCESLQEALRKYVNKPSMFTGIKGIWDLKPLDIQQPFGEPIWVDWNIKLRDILYYPAEANDRSIYWYWSNKGRTGKSTFANYLCQDRAKYLLIKSIGSVKDLSLLLLNAIKVDRWNCHCVIFDLPRSIEEDKNKSLYCFLEVLKDRQVSSLKYNSSSFSLPREPHVLILTNWRPCFGYLSEDRWCVKNIDPPSEQENNQGIGNYGTAIIAS